MKMNLFQATYQNSKFGNTTNSSNNFIAILGRNIYMRNNKVREKLKKNFPAQNSQRSTKYDQKKRYSVCFAPEEPVNFQNNYNDKHQNTYLNYQRNLPMKITGDFLKLHSHDYNLHKPSLFPKKNVLTSLETLSPNSYVPSQLLSKTNKFWNPQISHLNILRNRHDQNEEFFGNKYMKGAKQFSYKLKKKRKSVENNKMNNEIENNNQKLPNIRKSNTFSNSILLIGKSNSVIIPNKDIFLNLNSDTTSFLNNKNVFHRKISDNSNCFLKKTE